MNIRHYFLMKRRVKEIREHAEQFHSNPGQGMVADELYEDGVRMLDLCTYVDELMAMLEKQETGEEE